MRSVARIDFPEVTSDPVSPKPGNAWHNTTESKFKVYDGTTTRVFVFEPLPAGDFGSEFEYFESLGISTSTLSTFIPKINVTTASKPIGIYKVNWSYGWNYNATNTNFIAEIQADATTVMEHVQEPSDSGGNWNATGTDQRFRAAGSFYLNVTAASTIDLLLQFRSENAGTNASMFDARIDIWKVA